MSTKRRKVSDSTEKKIHCVFFCSDLYPKIILLYATVLESDATRHADKVRNEICDKKYKSFHLDKGNVIIISGKLRALDESSNWARVITRQDNELSNIDILYSAATREMVPNKIDEIFYDVSKMIFKEVSNGDPLDESQDIQGNLCSEYGIIVDEFIIRFNKPINFIDIYSKHNFASYNIPHYQNIIYCTFDNGKLKQASSRKPVGDNQKIIRGISYGDEDLKKHKYIIIISMFKKKVKSEYKQNRKIIYCSSIPEDRWDNPEKFYDLLINVATSNRISIPSHILEAPLSRESCARIVTMFSEKGIDIQIDILK